MKQVFVSKQTISFFGKQKTRRKYEVDQKIHMKII